MEPLPCVICGQHYEGFGNNAEPVAKGRCCDECNITQVIPARLHMLISPYQGNT